MIDLVDLFLTYLRRFPITANEENTTIYRMPMIRRGLSHLPLFCMAAMIDALIFSVGL